MRFDMLRGGPAARWLQSGAHRTVRWWLSFAVLTALVPLAASGQVGMA